MSDTATPQENASVFGIPVYTRTTFEPGTAYAISKCVDPTTCEQALSPLKTFPWHVLGIHDAVKIVNIGQAK